MAESAWNPAPVPELPWDLRVVAWLGILFGSLEIVGFFVAAAHGSFVVPLGILQLPAGIGLLRLRRGWRLVYLIDLGVGIAALILGLTRGGLTLRFAGMPLPSLQGGLLFAILGMIALLSVWSLRVLMRASTRKLFGLPL